MAQISTSGLMLKVAVSIFVSILMEATVALAIVDMFWMIIAKTALVSITKVACMHI